MENKIVPIAMPGIHERFYPYLKSILKSYERPEILEIGSGHGAFTKRLWHDGYHVTATDIFPGNFYFEEIVCHKIDIRQPMPFEDKSVDIIIAVEVMEHVHDHELFFSEAGRVLKNGGRLIFSTPNILSLKSRMRFLFSGFYYSFVPLDHSNNDGLQHLSSLTVDQYHNLAFTNGMTPGDIEIDKVQRTSMLFLLLFYPFLKLYLWLKKVDHIHNSSKLLLGRVLFMNFRKK